MNIELSYNATVEMAVDEGGKKKEFNMPLPVRGMSVKHGYIKNKHFIIPKKELTNIARTLKHGIDGTGAYLLKDHGYKGGGIFGGIKSVDNVLGKLSNAFVRDGAVNYKAKMVTDESLARLIYDEVITSSSVGLRVPDIYCSICGREYGHPECTHIVGKQYPDEELHKSVAEYLEQMDGVPTAAIVGKNIQGMEQSIILFPAIEGATAKAFTMTFSEDSEKYIKEIEKIKEAFLINKEKIIDASELLAKLGEISDTFNNNLSILGDENQMTDEKILELTQELLDVKLGLAKADDKNKTMITEHKTALDKSVADLTDLQAKFDTLTTDFNDLKAKDDTNIELLEKYKTADAARELAKRTEVVTSITALRTELGLDAKDYGDISTEMLEIILADLTAVKGTSSARGAVAVDSTKAKAKELAEKKEDLRELIFGERKVVKDD